MDDISYKIRTDQTIELSDGRIVKPMGILRDIHRERERLPIIAVERIGRRLVVTTLQKYRKLWYTQAFRLFREDEGLWPSFFAETLPGTIVTIANDDPQLFVLPDGGIAKFPYRVGFDVRQINHDRFVASCPPANRPGSPPGDNIWCYDRSGRLLWRVGHSPGAPDDVEYAYDYGNVVVRGELWALSEKAAGARIDLDTGAVLEVGLPPL